MEKNNYTPSQLGRAAMGDPNFVIRLLRGRQVTERNLNRMDTWMTEHRDGRPPKPVVDVTVTKAERVGHRILWTADLDDAIRRLRSGGLTWKAIGQAIGVSLAATRDRAIVKGLIE